VPAEFSIVCWESHQRTDFVRDTQTFFETRIPRREPNRFFGIALTRTAAAQNGLSSSVSTERFLSIARLSRSAHRSILPGAGAWQRDSACSSQAFRAGGGLSLLEQDGRA